MKTANSSWRSSSFFKHSARFGAIAIAFLAIMVWDAYTPFRKVSCEGSSPDGAYQVSLREASRGFLTYDRLELEVSRSDGRRAGSTVLLDYAKECSIDATDEYAVISVRTGKDPAVFSRIYWSDLSFAE